MIVLKGVKAAPPLLYIASDAHHTADVPLLYNPGHSGRPLDTTPIIIQTVFLTMSMTLGSAHKGSTKQGAHGHPFYFEDLHVVLKASEISLFDPILLVNHLHKG